MQKYLLTLILFLVACQDSDKSSETLIAKIGDKSISVNEFIRRAEYTIRPAYCRSDNYIHRKIVLNSLIAEKLLALEAGNENKLITNEDINFYLQGRKEQSMRQMLYNKEMHDAVSIDTNKIKQTYRVAGTTYDIAYMSYTQSQLTHFIDQELDKGVKDIGELYRKLGGEGPVPERSIGFNDPEHDAIHTALFSDILRTGQFVGPVRADNQTYTLIQIKKRTHRLAITEKQINERWESVKTKRSEIKANALYEKYIQDIMAGKRIDFEWETFKKLVNVLGPQYYKSKQDKEEAFNKKFWNKDNPQMVLDDLSHQMDEIMDHPLFYLNDEVWTVGMVQQAIKVHPFVFRKHKMPKSEFAEQLKLAIVDMIRDQYITEDAYKKGYDKVPEIERNYQMWRDNLQALYQREKYLSNFDLTGKSQMTIVNDLLTPYTRELYKKYHDQVKIDTEAFENTALTSIDMFVIQRNVPYPVTVPSFPQLTVHDRLDYGQKMSPDN
jgi:hypothetical protein